MKRQLFKSILRIVIVGALLVTLFGFQQIMPVLAAGDPHGQTMDVKQFLKPDGSLNLDASYNGNLDIENYGIILDPARGPVFKPSMAPGVWNKLGATLLNGTVKAIAISGSDVYVGGDFTNIGGNINMSRIAKWNGTAWSALGAGLNGTVRSIAISNANVVYAGGTFTDAGGGSNNADYIAQWDGTTWSALAGTTPLDNAVYAIAVNGTDVYIGGAFQGAGPSFANYIAKWDATGSTDWAALGATLNNGVYALAINSGNGKIYAGGTFTGYIAEWDGATWSVLGGGLNNPVYAVAISLPSENVYAGGGFTDAGGDSNADYIAKWNSAAQSPVWSALGGGLNDEVHSIAIIYTGLYAGGSFTNVGGNPNASHIAKWDGVTWSPLGPGLNNDVEAIAIREDAGHAVIGTYAGGNFTNNVASFVPDNTPPGVVSSTLVNVNPTNRANVSFTVTFSESVTGVDAADFSLATSGVTGASITGVSSGPSAVYTVSVNTGSNNGTIHLNVLNNNSIYDLATNLLSAAFSGGQTYTVSKTLTLYSAGSQDGWILESGETTNKGQSKNSIATTLWLGDTTAKQQYRAILSFGTASLPDNAVITSVILKVKKQAIVGGGNPVMTFQGLMADIKKGPFGTLALQSTDFQTTSTASTYKSYGPFKPTPVSNWYSINLTSGKLYINKLTTNNGVTQIRLRFKLDDNNNGTANYLSVYSGNAPIANRPQLIINYYVP